MVKAKKGDKQRLSITLSPKSAGMFNWLKHETDADTDSEVIRNALRLHYILLQGAYDGATFFTRSENGDTQIDLFVAK